ncbi:TPA: hypothetical protein ACKRQV_000033 [Pseudomonas aeruginosa]|nr:hypothetical protein [Pseudomonas aeruginosa]EIU2863541.1 hypothetical protein [Pseudomonas aeruginosa]HEK3717307.1 hypothetical protein [Pseudomonas aeruginosa]
MHFAHEPIRPVRLEVLGELVYVSEWQALMSQQPHRLLNEDERTWLDVILHDMDIHITQRHASVAASLVRWFGTNCGLAFLEVGKRAVLAQPRLPTMAWVGAWAVENYRHHGINSGFRTLEHILAGNDDLDSRGDLARIPALSPDDYEVAEKVCAWLGTYEGERYLERCEDRINLLRAAAKADAGRIIPSSAIPGAVWVTPFARRDCEELCLGGQALGGWKVLDNGEHYAFVNKLGGVAVEETQADMGSARAWVEAHAAPVVRVLAAN